MTSKVGAAALAAAIGVVLVYLIELFTRVDLPTTVEGAIVVLLTFITGYLVPETNPSQSAQETLLARGWGKPSEETRPGLTGPLR